jgi:hypothetical protein
MTVTKSLRRFVEQRAHERCEYCHYPLLVSGGTLHVEHIVPRSQGGSDDPENLALSCQRCNGHKADKMEGLDPETGHKSRLFHPRQDVWDEHFALDRETGRIDGLTPTGRATAWELRFNEPHPVAMRKLLIQYDLI